MSRKGAKGTKDLIEFPSKDIYIVLVVVVVVVCSSYRTRGGDDGGGEISTVSFIYSSSVSDTVTVCRCNV